MTDITRTARIIIASGLAAVTLAACAPASLSATSKLGAGAATSTSASASQDTTTTAPPIITDMASQVKEWWDNGVSSQWDTVMADISSMTDTSNNGDYSGLMVSSATLSVDVSALQAFPAAPDSELAYDNAMAWSHLLNAADAGAAGDWIVAKSSFDSATIWINQATARAAAITAAG